MTNIIQNLQPNVGHLKLTRTMLEKHIIDAVVNITAELMDKSTPNQNTIQAKRWGLICGN